MGRDVIRGAKSRTPSTGGGVGLGLEGARPRTTTAGVSGVVGMNNVHRMNDFVAVRHLKVMKLQCFVDKSAAIFFG